MTDKSTKILVVDDEDDILTILHDALTQQGYQVAKAINANEAFSLVGKFEPDLVLTDHDMPGFSGLEMLKELREQHNYTAVMFVSARGEPNLVAQALREGADDYVRKPFRLEELFARVEATLRVHALHKELKEANRKLQGEVDRDYLTELYNMRTMYDRIEFELKRAKRFGRPVACVMMDMDHFKSVNDFNDHLFGSFVLKEVGVLIKSNMREIDFAARYGGDEFLLVLTETHTIGVKIFCDRLCEAIAGHEFDNGVNKMNLTASMGFAMTDGQEGLSAKELVRRADHALYEAKDKGRNRYAEYVHGVTKQLSQKEE
jgi:two-component system cell cycle response regulator